MVARHAEEPQLRMVWPAASRRHCPAVHPAAGYSVRTFRAGDEQAFLSLMSLMDFDPWDDAKLDYNMSRIIPDGWFFATDPSDRRGLYGHPAAHRVVSAARTQDASDAGLRAVDRIRGGVGRLGEGVQGAPVAIHARRVGGNRLT